jgi:hypothetical protein
MAQPRLDALARAERGDRVGRAGAGHQEGFGAAFAQPQAQRLHVADQAEIALLLGPHQQVGERRAGQPLLLAAFERPEAGHQPRFGRERGEQALREGVDGLDAKPAAGRLEHPREQGAGEVSHFGPGILVQRRQLELQLRILEPHPVGEPGMDPLGHLGRAGLGEGQAEDRGGVGAGEQQPQHPRREHVGLAGAGRGRKCGVVARRRGAALVALQMGERGDAA